MIATYALCGFSNISSIGIQLGILGGMVPSKVIHYHFIIYILNQFQKALLSRIAPRALFAGSVACFMTACVAGR